MSRWTGLVIAGSVLVVAMVALGQPMWQIRLSDPPRTDTWSYGLFGVTEVQTNATTGEVTTDATAYAELVDQPNLAAVFLEAQYAVLLSLAALLAATGLAVATGLRRLRGLYAGIALLAACFISLYAALALVATVPGAAADLPTLRGQPVFQFEGQIIAPGAGTNSTILSWGPGIAWYLFLGTAVVLAYGATEVWSVRPAGAPERPPQPGPEADLPPPPPWKVEPLIEEVFVIAPNGLLVKHMSRSLMQEMDRDVVGSMIAVVSSFVRDAFPERDGNVKEVILGDHRFVLASDRGLVVAVLATRGEAEDIVHRLRHLLALLSDRYGTALDDWHGESLPGIEDEIAVLWQPFFLPAPPTD